MYTRKKMEEQIKTIYYKAFCDKINESISSEKPDYDWILSLYKEIKCRMLAFVKPKTKIYKHIDGNFDEILFDQMIKNKAFNLNDLMNLVNFNYDCVMKLQAPIRDEETSKSKQKVLQSKYPEIVSLFIIEINKCLDNIVEDLKNLKEELNK